jgi:hypothetical protein
VGGVRCAPFAVFRSRELGRGLTGAVRNGLREPSCVDEPETAPMIDRDFGSRPQARTCTCRRAIAPVYRLRLELP